MKPITPQITSQNEPPKASQKHYEPRGAALDVLNYKGPELLISGPAGTGKSRVNLEKLHIAGWRYPKMRGLILRKVRKSVTQSAMITFEQRVLPDKSPVYWHGGDQEYRFPNGSVIVVGGLDRASKALSTEYDMVYIMQAEELNEDDYEQVTTRLRNWKMPYQQLLSDANPGSPTHFLKRRAAAGKLKMVDSHHQDNPELYDRSNRVKCQDCNGTGRRLETVGGATAVFSCTTCDGRGTGWWTDRGMKYLAILDALTGVRYKRLRLGIWAAAEGMVYDNFEHDRHVIQPFQLPAAWPRYRVIDFGYTHPFVCQWWAESPDGTLYLYRELYGTRVLVEDWCKKINLLEHDKLRENIQATIADPEDAEGRATVEKYLECYTTPANKAVSGGIQAVQTRLKVQPNGKAGMYFFADALVERDPELESRKLPGSTIEEFDGYVWLQRADGAFVKDTPLKKNDHGMDTTRYMAMFKDSPQADNGQNALEQFQRYLDM